VHRDLKPTNVLVQSLGAEDHAKLLDFGFAKFFGAAGARANNSLTAQGTAFGTTGYIAPEQLSSATVDGRADLYAAGVILFESLVGRRPFDHGDAIEELRATLLQPPPSLESARPDLAIATMLDPILARALAKDPAERFGSATEMIEALEPFLPARSSLPSSAPVVPSPPIVPSTRITPSAGPEAPTTAFVAPAAARSTAATGGTTLLERAAALPSSVWVAAAAAMLMIALLAASVAWIGESAPEPPPSRRPGATSSPSRSSTARCSDLRSAIARCPRTRGPPTSPRIWRRSTRGWGPVKRSAARIDGRCSGRSEIDPGIRALTCSSPVPSTSAARSPRRSRATSARTALHRRAAATSACCATW
jgi:serine/threonine protein kinase